MKLSQLITRTAAAFRKGPIAISKVDGFSIDVKEKQGVMLTSTVNDEKLPASEDTYYEVTVNVDGSNPEYPAREKPYVRAFTIALERGTSGFAGGVSFTSKGNRWTKFELVEVHDKSEEPPMGKWMPPHHRVDLVAHYRDAQRKPQKMSMSAWVRKSDRESAAWQAAARSPVTYI